MSYSSFDKDPEYDGFDGLHSGRIIHALQAGVANGDMDRTEAISVTNEYIADFTPDQLEVTQVVAQRYNSVLSGIQQAIAVKRLRNRRG